MLTIVYQLKFSRENSISHWTFWAITF